MRQEVFSINAGPVFARLKLAQAQGPAVLGKTLWKFANKVMTDAKENYVPVRPVGETLSGQLRGSGIVEKPVKDADGGMSCRMFFGGPANAYALAVHEHLSEHSPPSWVKAEAAGHSINWTWPNTGPKYLERPLMVHSGELPAAGGEALKELFQGNYIEAPSDMMEPDVLGWVG